MLKNKRTYRYELPELYVDMQKMAVNNWIAGSNFKNSSSSSPKSASNQIDEDKGWNG
jgi:hypothetical protein